MQCYVFDKKVDQSGYKEQVSIAIILKLFAFKIVFFKAVKMSFLPK